MLALVAMLVLAQADGGVRAAVLAPQVLYTADGGELAVGGGCWLDERTCVAAGARAAGQTTENAELRKAVRDWEASGWWSFAGGAVSSAVVAIAGFRGASR